MGFYKQKLPFQLDYKVGIKHFNNKNFIFFLFKFNSCAYVRKLKAKKKNFESKKKNFKAKKRYFKANI